MSDRHKDQILDAATAAFMRYGYRRVTMGDLAKEAGISRPTLYAAFASKEDIFKAVATRMMHRALEEIRERVGDVGSLAEKLELVFEIWVVRHYQLIHKLPDANELIECTQEFSQDVIETAYAGLERLLQSIIEPYATRGLEPQQLAHTLAASARGIKQYARDVEDLRALLAGLVAMTVQALSHDPSAAVLHIDGQKGKRHGGRQPPANVLTALLLMAASTIPLSAQDLPVPRFAIATSPIELTGDVRPHQYVGVQGRRAAWLGTETGEAELWVHPLELASDFQLAFRIPDYTDPVRGADVARTVTVRPELTTITYSHAAFYRPLDTAVPQQFFATSMLALGAFHGMLGWEPDAPRGRARLAPQLPAHWPVVRAHGLKVGRATVQAVVLRSSNTLSVQLRAAGGEPVIGLELAAPPGARIATLTLDNSTVSGERVDSLRVRIDIPLAGQPRTATLQWNGGLDIVPPTPELHPGQSSDGIRVLDFAWRDGGWDLLVEGLRGRAYELLLAGPMPGDAEGATLVPRADLLTGLRIDFASGDGRETRLVRLSVTWSSLGDCDSAECEADAERRGRD